MKYINISFILLSLSLFFSGSLSQPIYIQDRLIVDFSYSYVSGFGFFGYNVTSSQLNITIGEYWNQRSINISYIDENIFTGIAPNFSVGYYDVRIYNKTTNQMLYYGSNKALYTHLSSSSLSSSSEVPTPSMKIQIDEISNITSTTGIVFMWGYFGLNANQINITIGDYSNQKSINITYFNMNFIQGIAPLFSNGYYDTRIYNKTTNELLYYGQNKILYNESSSYETSSSVGGSSSSVEESSEVPTPSSPITIDEISNITSTTGIVYIWGYFGLNVNQINITIGDKLINITYFNMNFIQGIAPLFPNSYYDVAIYNTTANQILYYGQKQVLYQIYNESSSVEPSSSSYETSSSYEDSSEVPTPNPSTKIQIDEISNITSTTGIVFIWGYFGLNVNQINITIGDYSNQKSINITYFNMNFVQGIAPLFSNGYYDTRIYNKTTNELLYYGQKQVLYQIYNESSSVEPSSSSYEESSEVPTPSSPITIDEISNITSTTGIVYIWGYFGLNVNQINITIGDYSNQKSINITYFNMNFVQGIAPLFSNGYYDVRIYNKTTNELLYYGQKQVLYKIYNESSSSYEASSSSSAIEPTPTPSQSPIIKCEYSSNGFIINSTESIECKGVGPTYCETNSGSTCSTDSSNSTIKCTTKSKSPFTSSLNCIGNNIECKSLYFTCSINKLQSSYLLVNGIEQKSNYYEHPEINNINSQENNSQDNNSNSSKNQENNSSSASSIYSSLSLLVLLISTILIIY